MESYKQEFIDFRYYVTIYTTYIKGLLAPCTEIPSDKKRNQTANNIALAIQAIKKQTMGGPPILLRISGLLLYCELLLKNICYPIC